MYFKKIAISPNLSNVIFCLSVLFTDFLLSHKTYENSLLESSKVVVKKKKWGSIGIIQEE